MTPCKKGRALVVGINSYPGEASLTCCVNDANEIEAVLQYPEYDFTVTSLLDKSATRKNIFEELIKLYSDTEVERVLFYFSGHGISTTTGAYIVTPDGTEFEPGVSFSFLTRCINSYRKEGRLAAVILDCCHAGALAMKGSQKGIRKLSQELLRDSIGGLPEGSAILAACKSSEVCLEDQSIGHGIFTAHILDGMLGKAANDGGDITIGSLYDFISRSSSAKPAYHFVFKGDFVGYRPLGVGFQPIEKQTANEDLLRRIEGEGQGHIDGFQKQIGPQFADARYWPISGFKCASQLLAPLVRWFEQKDKEYPEIGSRPKFRQSHATCRSWQIKLSVLDGIEETPWGKLTAKIGSGTFGTVWKISRGDSLLALKVYNGQDLYMKDKLARFRRGYQAMQQLDHPQIVKVHQFVECPIGFFMDFINGPNMREFVWTIDPSEQLSILLTIGETLSHAHGRGVIHRDVKPENIVMFQIGDRWVPNLTDFDLAWFSTASSLTKEGFGSQFYAAPEQIFKPNSTISHEPTVDVYSFGQLLFYALTKTDPVPGSNNLEVLSRRISSWVTGDAALEIHQLYEATTQTNPHDRIENFREICDRIYRAITLMSGPTDARIESDRFLREVTFGLSGLEGSSNANVSLSGKTQFSFAPRWIGKHELSVRMSLDRLEPLTLPGLETQEARKKINIRIDEALRVYRNVKRHSVIGDIYQVYIDIDNLSLNIDGVIACRKIASRAIEAMERE